MAMAKVSLNPNFKAFFESLNSAGVKYLLLGGYAVNFYGYLRSTNDIDVWIAVDDENARRVSEVFQSFGGFPPEAVPYTLFLQKQKVFIFGREPVRIDVITGPNGVEFAECYARRVDAVLDGIPVSVISLDDLKQNKRASARFKDLADLENLPGKPSATE
jgi:hypothetical protein